MFGFISKWKKEVLVGFEAVHQRIVTLEAQVAALFNHTKTVAADTVSQTKDNVTAAVTAVEDKVDQAKDVAADVAQTVSDVKGD